MTLYKPKPIVAECFVIAMGLFVLGCAQSLLWLVAVAAFMLGFIVGIVFIVTYILNNP